MKTKIKQLTVIIALLLLCTIVLSCAYGCTKENGSRFDTDLFHCMYNEDKTGVIILELTEKGQEQEILVIPEEINGLPVVQLGGETKGYPYVVPHYLRSDTIKRVYVGATVLLINESFTMGRLEDIIVYPFSYEEKICVIYNQGEVRTYINKGINGTDYFNKHGFHPTFNEHFYEANITFYSEPEDMYFVDNYSASNLYYMPEAPQKEGYYFVGWYSDVDLNNMWDGKYPDSQEETLNLYAKWENE